MTAGDDPKLGAGDAPGLVACAFPDCDGRHWVSQQAAHNAATCTGRLCHCEGKRNHFLCHDYRPKQPKGSPCWCGECYVCSPAASVEAKEALRKAGIVSHEEEVEQLRASNAALTTEVAGLRERLGEAEGLIDKMRVQNVDASVIDAADAFLLSIGAGAK